MTRNEKLLFLALSKLHHRIRTPHNYEKTENGYYVTLTFREADLSEVMTRAKCALDGLTPEQAAHEALRTEQERLEEMTRQASKKADEAEVRLMAEENA